MLCQTKLMRRGSHQQAEEKKQVVYGVLCIGQKVQLNFFFFASAEPDCDGGDAEEGFCTGSKLSLLGRGFLFPGD